MDEASMSIGRIVVFRLLFFAVFILAGPIIGGMVFWIGGGLAIGAVTRLVDGVDLAFGALGVSIALAPLGMIQALMTALISWGISKRILSQWKWFWVSVLAGALTSLFSLLTILAAFVFARDYGGPVGAGLAAASMLVTGGISAAICAAICLEIRPRAVEKT